MRPILTVMPAANPLFSFLLSLTGILCLGVALLVWQRRHTSNSAGPLVILLLALSWWDLTYAVFWAGVPGPTPFFWLDITYVGVVTVPTALLLFAAAITHRQIWLRMPTILALAVEPVLVLGLMFTDPWHDLFYGGKRMLNTGVIIDGGPVFVINLIYTYLFILIATVWLVQAYIKSSGIFQKQLGTVLSGIAITWINSLILLWFTPLSNADNTPFSFSISALLFAYAIIRYRLLDLGPIARDILIDSMTDGVIVLDNNEFIVDFNPAAKNSLANRANLYIGASIESVLETLPELQIDLLTDKPIRAEFKIGVAPFRHFDVEITPLFTHEQKKLGWLVVWRDITERKQLEEELQRQATTDSLTNISNRRHFLSVAENELQRATRYRHPLSIVLIDIDKLKEINDTFGHDAGDQALIFFTQTTLGCLRGTDLLGRQGGDEFALLLPETDTEQALAVVERIRQKISVPQPEFLMGQASITASFGIVTTTSDQETLESLLTKADQALYRAKDQGRDAIAY